MHPINVEDVIDYPAEKLCSFYLYTYEWIDNLFFQRRPEDFILPALVEGYRSLAHRLFTAAGWAGNGQIRLVWLPPFLFNGKDQENTRGVVVWHVKQEQDGLSWILSPIKLPNCVGGEVVGSEDEASARVREVERQLNCLLDEKSGR